MDSTTTCQGQRRTDIAADSEAGRPISLGLIAASLVLPHLDSDLARVSPLCRAHIIPTGTYSFEPEMPGVDIAHNTLP